MCYLCRRYILLVLIHRYTVGRGIEAYEQFERALKIKEKLLGVNTIDYAELLDSTVRSMGHRYRWRSPNT